MFTIYTLSQCVRHITADIQDKKDGTTNSILKQSCCVVLCWHL